ncbi:MAG: hypothetical protein GY847_05505, partial [Proteobacteria bacterium]|nr:hypothetical protein [Pseudomonadota bacterium]
MEKRMFRLLTFMLVFLAVCLVPSKQTEAATGSISASVKYVMISSGLGSTTITYSSSGCSTAQVYVNTNNTYDKLMSQNPYGTCNVDWILPEYAYTFRLYADTDRTEQLDSVTVIGIASNSGTVAARESEVIIPSGSTTGSAEITYGVNGYSTGQVYVQVNDGGEALMSQYPSATCNPEWIQDGYKYTFNLYAGTDHTMLLDSVTLHGRKYEYRVGSNYNATGTDFTMSSFLRDYHVTSVRNTVLSQLQGMANSGATHLRMGLWPVSIDPSNHTETWRLHFPMNTQELTNLRTYAQDVADIVACDGRRLFLDMEFCWIWASDYTVGTPTTTMGMENLSPTTYINYVTTIYQDVVDAVYDIYRPDGKKVIGSICFDNETMSHKDNTLWFYGDYDDGHSGLYEGFVNYCQNHDITPGLEPIVGSFNNLDTIVMNPNYTDVSHPILNGHGGMYWPYRTLKLFQDNDIYIPARINFSMYPAKGSYTYSQVLNKVFDDADAVLPSLGVRKYYRLTETYYLNDSSEREELGAAICEERLRRNRVTGVQFWNTPYNSGWPLPSAYPFDFSDYLPIVYVNETYGLTISSTTGGSVTTPGEGTFPYNCGANVSLVAVPATCYRFVNWTGDV